ncbi:SIS domain-containing protein [Actinophytocola sp.]|uniref:SIS domain-containing protein n=1 Tax=Actinophytocola sp. TaxID=1872138 RepID=UPI003D6A900E
MSHVLEEIVSQPDCWARAVPLSRSEGRLLPVRGERVAVIGCGTSLFMGQAYAVLRESAGQGLTDAFPASEFPRGRQYDKLLAVSRSGTTTEVLDVLDEVRGRLSTTAITAGASTPIHEHADQVVAVEFADEESTVQTRFATTTLALLRAHLGHDLVPLIADARRALDAALPVGHEDRRQFTFLGRGWTVGLAHEAALKMREAALAWAESYPAMEYRHGPISISDEHGVVWSLGAAPPGLAAEVAATAALFVEPTLDPMAELIRCQRLAVSLAVERGLDPDRPRHLSRAVILGSNALQTP